MQDLIAAHRRKLADALEQLTAEQWHGHSLCTRWTPAHVLAHQTMPFRITEQDFMTGLQRCSGDFTAFSDEIADRDSSIPASELVAALRNNADNPWSPGSPTGALSHDVIHGLDIGWPLALDYEIPAAAMTAVLDSVTGPLVLDDGAPLATEVQPSTGGRTLFGFPIDGITVSATDLDWSAGTGPELAGRSRDLLMLLAGRAIPADRFSGEGAERVRTAGQARPRTSR